MKKLILTCLFLASCATDFDQPAHYYSAGANVWDKPVQIISVEWAEPEHMEPRLACTAPSWLYAGYSD